MTQHYFSPDPQAPHRPGLVRVVLPDIYLELETDAGMFSPGRLDPGTRLLLEEAAPAPPAGDLLDLGCGYGPVACVLAARSPAATVWAVDVNERALELCRRNAERAGLANVRCLPPGELPRHVDAIWSNPPIRIGKDALHDMLRGWLARLDGQAHLVVGRHLGADSLAAWLAAQGWPATRLAARSGYRLLQLESAASERHVVPAP
ncbi:MAG TPA: methyltransferase [Streptosporangiaceae bacterium]|nr:methyltransferase [Streptosporangiaceae bacterium]